MARTKAAVIAAAVLSSAGLAGCAGNQALPDANIQQAEQRIDEAERADAQRFANRELNMARERLLAAREAQQDGDEERATRLAQLAQLDAEYAAAVADNQEVQAAVDELRETISTLEQELERQQDSSFGGDAGPVGPSGQPGSLTPGQAPGQGF